jgi:hypothetical protein
MQYNLEEGVVKMEYKLSYAQFVEGLKQGKLLGFKCNKCGAYTCPPKKVCLECNSEDMEVVELTGKGKLQTFNVTWVAPEGFEAPYIVAEAELEEGPWVLGNLIGVDPSKATMDLMGQEVKVGCKTLPGDQFSGGERVALTFTPVK